MNIESHIQKFVADNFLFSEGVFEYDNETSFLREGIIDSLGVMELVSFVESQYGIRVSPQDVTPDNFDSVTKLADYIRSRLPKNLDGGSELPGLVSPPQGLVPATTA